MEQENSKKRERLNSDEEEEVALISASKRQKVEEVEKQSEAPLIPTLLQIASEQVDCSCSYLALHKTREDRDRFFQWMNRLEDTYNYTVLSTAMSNEDPTLLVKEMQQALKEEEEKKRKWSKKKREKIDADLELFEREEKKEDFLGVWIQQKDLSLGNCIPRPLESNGLPLNMEEFRTLLAADFC